MRISERILSTVLFGLGLGLATAYAFDGTRSPSDIAPAVGIEVLPRSPGVTAGTLAAPTPPQGGGFSLQSLPQGGGLAPLAPSSGLTSFQALQSGTRALRAGDTQAGLQALEYAAANGQPMAAWKLGRMYADGDGVPQSDLRAFEYFRGIADAHADEVPGTPQARFVANAFVALGSYYRDGIANSEIRSDADRAREMFAYAASYFGDPDAQYQLGRMYLDGQGGIREPKQAARWLSLAARKGQYQAQAVFGAMLFKGEYVPRQGPRGLMWLTLARDAASPRETWISDLYAAALKQATEDERAVALVYLERWLKGRKD
jgi:TPR repeat protein